MADEETEAKGRQRWRPALKWGARLSVLAVFLLASLGGVEPDPLHASRWDAVAHAVPAGMLRATPQASPLTGLSALLDGRAGYFAFPWALLPLAMVGLALWKGRFFCQWLCPLGTLYALTSRWSLNRKLFKRRWNGVVFWSIAAGSLIGAPTLLWLDPLSTVNRLHPLLLGTFSAAALAALLIMAVFLVLGFIQPMAWCSHFCPLGYLLGLARLKKGRRPEGGRAAVDPLRRELVVGAAAGLAAAVALRFFRFPGAMERRPLPVLPPGASTPDRFASACTRCYACVDVCPSKVLQARWDTNRSLSQWLQPEIRPDYGVCLENCNACTRMCPAGALEPLSMDEKRQRKIGNARIGRDACLAWADKLICGVCAEVCPYSAIELVDDPKGVPMPFVHTDRCRGCGACQNACPATRLGKAIVVDGVSAQMALGVSDMAPWRSKGA